MFDQSTSLLSKDREHISPFDLKTTNGDVEQHRYRGPYQGAVYSPMPALEPSPLVGESKEIKRVLDLIDTAAKKDLNVLIQGESGTGKSLSGRRIHCTSGRRREWLIVVNCELVESENLSPLLLGNGTNTQGLLDAASGGTVILDHVDKLSPGAQAHLNHILETHTFEHLGQSSPIAFDVRFISTATSKLSEGKLRKDLYHRLSSFLVSIPPLRNRSDDILRLARYFLRCHSEQKQDGEKFTLSSEAKAALRRHTWPDNVRELQNVIVRAAVTADDAVIREEDLVFSAQDSSPIFSKTEGQIHDESIGRETDTSDVCLSWSDEEIPTIEDVKRQLVEHAFKQCDRDVDWAALELGVGRSTMYRMLKRYDIKE